MLHPYRVYRNGRCVAFGGYATARAAFRQKCEESNPALDVVLLVDHFRNCLDSF